MALSGIKGVGPKTSHALAGAGLFSIFDLLLRVPKSLVEEFDCPGFLHMEAGRTYIAQGKVVASKQSGFGHKKRLEAIIQDETGRLYAVFFGPAVNYAQTLLKTDAEITLIGEAKHFLGRVQMVHPKLVSKSSELIAPSNKAQYSQIGGILPKTFKAVVDKALDLIKENGCAEHVPQALLQAHKLCPLPEALNAIHRPGKERGADWDQRMSDPNFGRLAFEELVAFYVSLFVERRSCHVPDGKNITRRELSLLCEGVLPFALTSAQARVVNEIIDDMQSSQAMSRLVQGDVGSGKTAVSALAALHVCLEGGQVAVMAPTEILAEQLYSVYSSLLSPRGLLVVLITASTKTKQRKALVEQIKTGEVAIVIGTHALLSDDITFKALDLLIIDEQHRFGVKQRAALLHTYGQRQGYTPHLLVMSATPIPRSLALTLHGDLDLSVIDERPPGRKSIETKVLRGAPLDSLMRLAMRIVETKQKAFVVFPLVEESEHLDLENATKAAAMLKQRFGEESCLLLHGRMAAHEKQEAMTQFKNGHTNFLVATTVIEVGVDVPDATCMAIIHPERFGLAQLHQLRGRIGRGTLASYCFLLTDIKNPMSTSFKRIEALCKTQNGFELAQTDLALRGPGELLGTRQAGMPTFHIFNHTDFAPLVDPAKRYAKQLVETKINIAVSHLLPNNTAHFS